ncbi:RICIN domain-containing protein [Streptomyces sp. SBT349]|uniref:RICIN domain-containing protein n=1 Tax=Streptomyces sp. SBT349 TaxID=1580539 RepID=UPI00131D0B8E|nr:RICIN domain-containing protein [Streptomyces sp. SBT349]
MAVALMSAVAAVIAPTPAQAAEPTRFELVNSHTGLRADVMGASAEPHTGVFLWPDNASTSQEYELLDSGNGYFRIKARHSGQCLMLDWRAGFYDNGTPIIQYPSCGAGYAPAEWSISWAQPSCTTPCFATTMLIRNRATGMCLDVAAPSGVPGQQSPLQQWSCIAKDNEWNTGNQSWTLKQLNNLPIIH